MSATKRFAARIPSNRDMRLHNVLEGLTAEIGDLEGYVYQGGAISLADYEELQALKEARLVVEIRKQRKEELYNGR